MREERRAARPATPAILATYSIVWNHESPGALQGARSHYWAPCKAPNSKENRDFLLDTFSSNAFVPCPATPCMRGQAVFTSLSPASDVLAYSQGSQPKPGRIPAQDFFFFETGLHARSIAPSHQPFPSSVLHTGIHIAPGKQRTSTPTLEKTMTAW